MSIFRRANNPNLIVGIVLLILLAFLAGPNTLPRLISALIPDIDESIPCAWLRQGLDRSEHQSLIGRAATSPISLRVRASAVPTTPDGLLTITVIVTNNSIGSVAIVYDEDQVRIGDDGVGSGLGLAFNAPGTIALGGGQGQTAYPETEVRILGPRQTCVHKAEFSISQLPAANIATGTATVKAYYRNTTPGIVQDNSPQSTPVYTDQGLWVGVTESESVPIPLTAGT
ncbi:MAG TPA: hypothetical protein VHO69_12100 [Phototrophicaceae bacterium]|nr:hypothetical protein [Phototrophicaceae bacterium]